MNKVLNNSMQAFFIEFSFVTGSAFARPVNLPARLVEIAMQFAALLIGKPVRPFRALEALGPAAFLLALRAAVTA